MVNYIEQIKELEAEIKKTPYNKATQHHIGLVKARIAKLREQQMKRSSSRRKGQGYELRKSGDSTVILIGYPSVGKSTLLNALTSAGSKVGTYAFTTLSVIPGVLQYRHARIQILDVPGVVKGAAIGTGRGREVLSVMRNADLAILIIEVGNPEHLELLIKEIHDAGLRINQTEPDVRIRRTAKGGIRVGSTVRLTRIDEDTITGILNEFRVSNADVIIRQDIDADQLIDAFEGNRHYLPAIIVLNKTDLVSKEKTKTLMREIRADIGISAKNNEHIGELKELIFGRLSLMSIYLKEPGKEADLKEPLIIFRKATLRDLCSKLHRDFMDRFRFARIWGSSVRYSGQRVVKLRHTLHDSDIVELHID